MLATQRLVVARWESASGKHWVELYRDGAGYGYRAPGASGWLGAVAEAAALAELERRVGDFQPDTNKRPMRRVFGPASAPAAAPVADGALSAAEASAIEAAWCTAVGGFLADYPDTMRDTPREFAWRAFVDACKGKTAHPAFELEAPRHARLLLLCEHADFNRYASGGGQ